MISRKWAFVTKWDLTKRQGSTDGCLQVRKEDKYTKNSSKCEVYYEELRGL
jgi:hypothetical protein